MFKNQISNFKFEGATLREYVRKQKNEDAFKDVEFKAGGKMFKASKILLSSYSPFLERKFLSEGSPYDLEEVDAASMEETLEILYTEKIDVIRPNNVASLLMTAKYLEIDEIVKCCRELISKNLDQVSSSDQFVNLPHSIVKDIIQNLYCDSCEFKPKEAKVFRAIEKWGKSDPESRAKSYCDLFLLVNLDDLARQFLKNEVLTSRFVSSCRRCTKKVEDCLQWT